MLGKPDYIAPEQFDPYKFSINGKINTNVDLWSFGIILYEAFLHRTPFDGDDENPMRSIQSITRDSLTVLNEIPVFYRKIIRLCLVRSDRKRVQSAREIIPLMESMGKTTEADYAKTSPLQEL